MKVYKFSKYRFENESHSTSTPRGHFDKSNAPVQVIAHYQQRKSWITRINFRNEF